MDGDRSKTDFVTPGRITLATNYARDLAEREPWSSASDCAEKAVRQIFGRWLQDPTAAIHPQHLPLYFQLVARVESQMGVHRVPRRGAAPWRPWPGPAAMAVPQPVGM